MLVQQKIAINKSIENTSKVLSHNWFVIPLLFIYVFNKIALINFNNQLAPLFLTIPFIFTLFMFSFNPFVNKINNQNNKLRLKMLIMSVIITILIAGLSYYNMKGKDENENKNLIENVSYGLLIFNYVIFLVFNVFFRYSGLNILSKFDIKVSEEINTKYTFFFFIAIFMLIIFTVSQPKNINNKFIKKNGYGILLISPLILLLLSYGINIFRKDKSLLLPYVILCICTLMYIINSGSALGYNNEILDKIKSNIKINLKNMEDENKEIKDAKKKIEKENLLYEKKIDGVKKITSKIPILFSLITFLLFLVYSIKIKTNPISSSLLLLFCFTIYLSFVMGTTFSNYNINNKLKNDIYKVNNFYWGKEDTKKNYEMLMLAIIIIGVILAFSYGYINFFNRNVNTKNYIIKTIIGFIILAASSFFSYYWGMNVATYNSPLMFDDKNIYNNAKYLNEKYMNKINDISGAKENGNNILLPNEENSVPIKTFKNEDIILGNLTNLKTNNFKDITDLNECSIDKQDSGNETEYSFNFFNLDINKVVMGKRGVHNYKSKIQGELYYIPQKNKECQNHIWKEFKKDEKDEQTSKSFKKNILMKLINNEDTYKKYFGYENEPHVEGNKEDEKFDNLVKFYEEKKVEMENMFNNIDKVNEKLSNADFYLPEDDKVFNMKLNSDNTNLDETKKIFYNIYSEELLKYNNEVKKVFVDNINNYKSDNDVGKLFSYSNILTIGLLFLGIFLLSNLKFKYDTIYDVFSITGNSGDNVFSLLYSVFIILCVFSIGVKIESANKSDLVSEKQIVPSILNSILALLYVATLLIPGLIKKIAFYVIVLLIHLSMFTIPLSEFKNKLSTNIIFLYVVLMSAIGISTYQVLSPSKNKYSSLYMLLIICAIFLTLHSAPSVFYLGDKDSENNENNFIKPETIKEIRESANNSWPVLIFGLVMGFILFSKIINPYNVGKLNLTPSKDFFFAKDNM